MRNTLNQLLRTIKDVKTVQKSSKYSSSLFIRQLSAVSCRQMRSSEFDMRKNQKGRIYIESDDSYDDEDDEEFERLTQEIEEEPLNIDYASLFDNMKCPKPSEIVSELDKFIIGQDKAKKSVAIALRNRWRARTLKKLNESLELTPSNILMVGPTGCGKTEIARRLAKLSDAPFVKVEATNYTEVGFHGRDVDKILQDLFDNSLQLIREKVANEVSRKVDYMVESVLVNALAGTNSASITKEHFREMIRANEMEDQLVKIDLELDGSSKFSGANIGVSKSGIVVSSNLADFLNMGSIRGRKTETKSMKVSTAREKLKDQFTRSIKEELEESQIPLALKLAQERGIVFIDEIDKICSHGGSFSPNASSEGVQRDLLPLVEGSNVPIKQGTLTTDNVLFICAGSFHSVNVSDLIPELQGRLPIRVELEALSEEALGQTLKLEKNSLLEKYKSLLKVEEVLIELESDECIDFMANIAFEVNRNVENIGARRLHTIVEKVFEDLSFKIPEVQEGLQTLDTDLRKDTKYILKVVEESLGSEKEFLNLSVDTDTYMPIRTITKAYLEKKIGSLNETLDLEKFIL